MDMPVDVGNNQIIKDCLSQYEYRVENFDTFNFNQASACYHKAKSSFYLKEIKGLEAFLDANPQYRYPGGSNGNHDRCWGQNKSHLTRGGC